MNGHSVVQVKVWHVASFILTQLMGLVGIAFWVGSEAKQIDINSARITALEITQAEQEKHGTTSDRIRLDEVIERLKTIEDEVRSVHRDVK